MGEIKCRLAVLLAEKNMRLKDLSAKVNISETNLSLLKTGKAKAIRFSTLMTICNALDCQPGDLLVYEGKFPSRKQPPLPHLKSNSSRQLES